MKRPIRFKVWQPTPGEYEVTVTRRFNQRSQAASVASSINSAIQSFGDIEVHDNALVPERKNPLQPTGHPSDSDTK